MYEISNHSYSQLIFSDLKFKKTLSKNRKIKTIGTDQILRNYPIQ